MSTASAAEQARFVAILEGRLREVRQATPAEEHAQARARGAAMVRGGGAQLGEMLSAMQASLGDCERRREALAATEAAMKEEAKLKEAAKAAAAATAKTGGEQGGDDEEKVQRKAAKKAKREALPPAVASHVGAGQAYRPRRINE